MMKDRTRRIEERAHSLWEMEGRPHGRDAQHWQQAEREIDTEDAAKASAAADMTTRGRKPTAAAGVEPEAPKAKRGRPSKAAAETPGAASASGRRRKPKAAAATEGGEAPKATRGRKARAASEAGPVGAAADREPAPQDYTTPDEAKDRSPEPDLDTQVSPEAAGPSQTTE